MRAYLSLSKSGINCFLFVNIEVQITICWMTTITILFIICSENYSVFTPNCKHAIIFRDVFLTLGTVIYILEENMGGGLITVLHVIMMKKIKVFDS